MRKRRQREPDPQELIEAPGGGQMTLEQILAYEPGASNPASRKGWVDVDYDKLLWIPCPPGWLEPGYGRDEFAQEFAEVWWEMSGLKFLRQHVDELAAMLREIHASSYGRMPCSIILIHLPDPRMMPLPVYYGIFQMEGEREEALRMLTHADGADGVEPPITEEFTTERLGKGIRSLRYSQYQDEDGDAVFGALNYAFRSEQHATDLRVWTVSPDLGRLQRALPDIDTLVRVTGIISLEDLAG
jgi:hypothetical protein